MVELGDIVGMVGVVVLLLGYFLLQTGKISNSITFSVFNLIGSLMILFSLLFAWNLPAAVMEIAWVFLSIWGIVRVLLKRKKTNKSGSSPGSLGETK